MRLITTNSLVNNGTISANGNSNSSGGSIYVTINALSGSGIFQANGGGAYCQYTCNGPGGGGRVAVYYQTSSYTGTAVASGAGANQTIGGTSQDGTVEMINGIDVPQIKTFHDFKKDPVSHHLIISLTPSASPKKKTLQYFFEKKMVCKKIEFAQ